MSNIISTERVAREKADAREGVSAEFHDTRSCTINALANCSSFQYEVCYQLGRATGRKRNCGHNPEKLLREAKRYGLKYRKLKFRRLTLQKFVTRYPEGSYYCVTSSHAFAVVNGIVRDWHQCPDMVRIIDSWRIEEGSYGGTPVEVRKRRKRNCRSRQQKH